MKFNFLSNNTDYITSSGEHFPIMEGLWVVVGGRTDKNETKDLVQKDVLYIITSVTLTSIWPGQVRSSSTIWPVIWSLICNFSSGRTVIVSPPTVIWNNYRDREATSRLSSWNIPGDVGWESQIRTFDVIFSKSDEMQRKSVIGALPVLTR